MTPLTDSLVAALVRVLLAELIIEEYRAEEVASTLAVAAREWMTTQMPPSATGHTGTFIFADAYNECLDDVARGLGL